jgi:hypothetical protein
MIDAGAKGLLSRPQPKGEDNRRAKLTADQIRQIRARYAAGRISTYQLAREYSVGQMTICRAVNHKSFQNVA